MLRSILVALDGSSSSLNAARVALMLGHSFGAHVEGLGIVNSAWIQRPEPVPIGGTAIKAALDLKHLATARERVNAVLQNFHDEARACGVLSQKTREVEGNPVRLIEREATAHDLVTLGRNSLFDVEGELYDLPLCVERIVRAEPRPILLVPSSNSCRELDDMMKAVVLAFDGSPAASRALHMFALLGLAAGRSVHVVTVDNASQANAAETAGRACTLLSRHGVSQAHAIGLGDREAGTPSETILGLAKGLGAGLIVMGAYGHRGIREIFGSCTREVLNACPQALFLYH